MISSLLSRSLPLEPPFSLILSPNQTVFRNGTVRFRNKWRHSMCLSVRTVEGGGIFRISEKDDGILKVNGKEALREVPENVTLMPLVDKSMYLGASSERKSSRHVFKLGILQGFRLLCLFRFKLWWMVPRIGESGSDVPTETQMLLLEVKEELVADANSDGSSDAPTSYILFLPVLDGDFRSSLQGNSANELEFCIESGDPNVVASQFQEAVFLNYGENPFHLMKQSMKILEKHKGGFSHRADKTMPGMLDWFGWCTWDAFYHDVNPQGIKDGLRSLSEGGTPARFLIIDDGWQDVVNEFEKEGEPSVEGSSFGGRLVSIKENTKFRQNAKEAIDLKDFVTSIKKTFSLKYVYLWHALMGYWGGLHPNSPGTKKYNPKLVQPVQSPGVLSNMRDLSLDKMEEYGVGIIDPEKVFEFYDDLHGYLVSQNVDGVKVDVQSLIETIARGLGGRVSLTRQFHKALESSISRNFEDNGIICCMAHNTDSVYSSKVSAVTRASDDFWPKSKTSQTLHIAAVAFNSIFLGEVMVPDWDMFHSLHESAEFHAAARAVGGCGVYVSDKPGQHDFTVLKKLVLPDGSILRARYPGRPTRDCLFNDPVMDGKSLMKIWNLNSCTGVIGVFNCQGAGTWPCLDTVPNSQNNENPGPKHLKGSVRPLDIEFLEEVAGDNWTGDCAVFSFSDGSLSTLHKTDSTDVSLKILECEILTVSPIRAYNPNTQFAPIGLTDMYNSGGAVDSVDFSGDTSNYQLKIRGRGSGRFGAYSSRRPTSCTVNSREVEFHFIDSDFLLTVIIPPKINSWEIGILYQA